MPKAPLSEFLKTAGQVIAIAALLAYVVLLLHKGSIDLAVIAAAHHGSEFWLALGRHLLRVLGGG